MRLLLLAAVSSLVLTGCAVYPDAPPVTSYPQYGPVYGTYYSGPYYPYGPYYYDSYPYYRHDRYRPPERARGDRDDNRNENRAPEERARLNDRREPERSGRPFSPSVDPGDYPRRSSSRAGADQNQRSGGSAHGLRRR